MKEERGEARLQGEGPHVQVSEAYCEQDIFSEVREWSVMSDGER